MNDQVTSPKLSSQPIAVDVGGADRGIKEIVAGAVLAKKELGLDSILVGPEGEIRQALKSLQAEDLKLEVVHAPEVIEMSESPSRAVKRKPNSSLCVAYKLVNENRASAIISAGHTGAMMAAGSIICGLLPGVERPAIATIIPKAGDALPAVMLDCGANVDSSARNLMQFAVMGSVYSSSLLNIKAPKVGLLSNGTESSKGTDLLRQASVMLKNVPGLNYVGYVEGRDVASGVADVIVCDGFVGNVLLKAMEGCVRLIADQLRIDARSSLWNRIVMGLAKPVLKSAFLHKFDYTAYGGAPLLGLRKLGLVLHGSSDSRAVRNAVRVAHSFASLRMTERIETELSLMDKQSEDSPRREKEAQSCSEVVDKRELSVESVQ